MSDDLFELTPKNYDHAMGMLTSLLAAMGRLRAMAGTCFVNGDDQTARDLREVHEQFVVARNKLEARIKERWPEPPSEVVATLCEMPTRNKPRKRRKR